MARNIIQLHNTFCQRMLDIISINLGLDACIKFQNGEIIKSSMSGEDFCSIMNRRYPGSCECDSSSMDEDLHLCPAGLWVRIIPLIEDPKKIGAICVGQRMIKGKENESRDRLSNFLKGQLASEAETNYLLNLLDAAGSIDQTCFNIDKIKRYSQLIKDYLFIEKIQAQESEKRIAEIKALASNLSHQFLLPIQAILGNAENVITEYTKSSIDCQNKEVLEMLNEIFLEIIKLSYSAENLRSWIVNEKDIYKYEFTKKPIHLILEEAIRLFQVEASRRRIIIHYPLPIGGPFPILEISEEHIRRVFFNILNNAVKYSFDGTQETPRYIDIRCIYSGNYYCIETSNYGVGILPEEMELIFQTGYRGKLARDRSRYGSGLGMAVVKKIVEDHGGKVIIDSKRIESSKGSPALVSPYLTTISVCLPISQTRSQPSTEAKELGYIG